MNISKFRFFTYSVILGVTFIVLSPLLAQIFNDRFERSPVPHLAETESVAVLSTTKNNTATRNFLRFIEGIDPTPIPLTPEDISHDLQDPFGMLLAQVGADLPKTVNEVLAMMGPPNVSTTPLGNQTVYIVSVTGQIPVSAAPDLVRRPRGIVLRRNERGNKAVFIAPSFRETSTLEVMGWDGVKKLFNYYERSFLNGDHDLPIWLWKGDSSQAWNADTRETSCFRCHRNGEVNMKELRVPWQNWHSQSATIKPDSIPEDSPLRTNPLFSIEPVSPFLRGGDEFERVVNQWITETNKTKIAHFNEGKIDTPTLLEPFFRTTTANLKSSVELSASTGTHPITLPTSIFIDQRGMMDIGRLECDSMFDLPARATIPRTDYRNALAKLNFRLEEPGNYIESPGDTHFALLTSEVPRVDYDLVQQMVAEGLLSRQMATNLMLVDFVNPVYSPIRAEIYGAFTKSFKSSAGLEADILTTFKVLLDQTLPTPVVAEIVAFLERNALPEKEFEAAACKMVDSYLNAVMSQFDAGNFMQYMQLIASRYQDFARSDHHHLIESHLLLPKTNLFVNLVMRRDGRVGPSSLVNQQTLKDISHEYD